MAGVLVGLAGALLGVFWSRLWPQQAAGPTLPPGVSIQKVSDARLHSESQAAIASAPAKAMNRPGLAAATGGVRVRILSSDPQELLFPLPQLVDAQVPICHFVAITPAEAVADCRLRTWDGGAAVMTVHLGGKGREVRIAWSSVVLLAPGKVGLSQAAAESYRQATPCVQADADEIAGLAASLWPATGRSAEFAANIQRHIRQSTRREQPKSLDARGILKSGENGICTGNANLAAALMRAKGLACRTIAAIPTNAQRMEMHRIVEFYDNDQWSSFDPSSVYADVPLKPWQYIIMAKTTIQDEQLAMRPRMGAMIGAPYGHEAELLTPGLTLSGEDFFWTQAKLLAEFDATEQSVRLAADAWTRHMQTGQITAEQLKAASAKTAAAFEAALRGN